MRCRRRDRKDVKGSLIADVFRYESNHEIEIISGMVKKVQAALAEREEQTGQTLMDVFGLLDKDGDQVTPTLSVCAVKSPEGPCRP